MTINSIGEQTNGVPIPQINESIDLNNDYIDGHEIIIRQGGDFKSRFILEEELGKGRFGVVHRVIERETGQVLAAKIVKCIKAKDKLKVLSIKQHLKKKKIEMFFLCFCLDSRRDLHYAITTSSKAITISSSI